VAVLYGLGCAAVLAFTLGYHTRLACGLSFLFITSLHTRNIYVTDGGDQIARAALFTCLFTDPGRCFSLDVFSGRKQRGGAPALGLRFLQFQIALLYFNVARMKLYAQWLRRNAIFEVLQLTGFVRPPGALLLRFPGLCRGLTLGTAFLELLFPFAALSPWWIRWSRMVAIASGLLIQGGILLTMRVGVFTEVMLAANLLYVQPEWLDWIASRFGAPPSPARAPAPAAPATPVLRWVALVLLAVHFGGVAWGPLFGKRLRQPEWLVAERRWSWVDQSGELFSFRAAIPRLAAVGTRPDGSRFDAVPEVVPSVSPTPGFRGTRWYKMLFRIHDEGFPLEGLAHYFCREHRQRTGEQPGSMKLEETLTEPVLPGEPAQMPRTKVLWSGPCPSGS
jgi:hypothetical protein